MEYQGNKTRLSVFFEGSPGPQTENPAWQRFTESSLLVFARIQVLISASVWNPREKCELLAKSWGNSRGMESEKRPNTGRKAGIWSWPAEKFWFKSPTSVCCLMQESWNPPPPHHHHVTHTHSRLSIIFRFILCCYTSCYYTFSVAFISITSIFFIYMP